MLRISRDLVELPNASQPASRRSASRGWQLESSRQAGVIATYAQANINVDKILMIKIQMQTIQENTNTVALALEQKAKTAA